MQIKILCIGDLVGRPGRYVLHQKLSQLVAEHEIDCVICNVENSAGGSGLTEAIHNKLLNQGVHLMTMGDHIYRKRDIIATLQNSASVVRPANLSMQAAGREYAVYQTPKGPLIAVISLLGRMYMNLQADNPYNAIDRILSKLPKDIRIVIVDMHAEASSEKVAMGWHLDGRVSVVFGTHTHIVTADERILPKGTGYITDVGMTGPHESVIGRSIEPVLKSLITNMPFPYSIASGDLRLNGLIATVNSHTGQTVAIERVSVGCPSDGNGNYDQDDS